MVKKKGKSDWKGEVKCKSGGGCAGCGYFLGFLGAAVYYIQAATSFWGGVVGFLKAIVWPAFLVYDILRFIGA